MPEGPELYISSRFIKKVCDGRIFGKICKSEISKNPPVAAPFNKFTIDSCTRGKEVKLILTDADKNCCEAENKKSATSRSLEILFTFGLAGKFDFCCPNELQKHSHLCFYTADSGPEMVLSFVDYMRFGRWTINAPFSKDRGPCVLFDYLNFRKNVLENVGAAAFNKPICEVLLNQKYFNGIGNYLRAEILYRHGTPPFVSARSVLEPLLGDEVKVSEEVKINVQEVKIKSENHDILQLCNIVAMEVVNLEGDGYDLQDRADETKAFNSWLQCYYQDGMKNMADHNGRTIWFHGPAGPMAPKDVKTRGRKTGKKKKKEAETVPGSESDIKKTSKAPRGKRKGVEKGGGEELTEVEPSQERRAGRKRVGTGSQLQQEPPKKLRRRKKGQESSLTNSVLSERETATQSISELKSDIVMDSQYVTRGRMKSILNKGDNHVKSPAARTKTRARLSSNKDDNKSAAVKSRRNRTKAT